MKITDRESTPPARCLPLKRGVIRVERTESPSLFTYCPHGIIRGGLRSCLECELAALRRLRSRVLALDLYDETGYCTTCRARRGVPHGPLCLRTLARRATQP